MPRSCAATGSRRGPPWPTSRRRSPRRCDAPYAVAFSSGTAALHGAAFAAGVGRGDELVTSAITFAASANCGAYLGATPRFADIDPATWNVERRTRCAPSPASARAPSCRSTSPACPRRSRRSARRLPDDVTLIEDAAHALGARTRTASPSVAAATRTWRSSPSTPSSRSTTGEGGMVTTRDERAAPTACGASAPTASTQGSGVADPRRGRLVPRAARRSASTTG